MRWKTKRGRPVEDSGVAKPSRAVPAGRPSQPLHRRAHPDCGDKQYCREMASCEEALYYLNQCDVKSMDGDGDGVPCERGVCANR